jgi:hypothetical protein
MAESQKYGLWDTKAQSWVRNKQYDSLKGANKGSDRMDNAYGGYRYVPKLIPGSLPEKTSETAIDEDVVSAKKGGKISASQRADGIATRGKTRGKMI